MKRLVPSLFAMCFTFATVVPATVMMSDVALASDVAPEISLDDLKKVVETKSAVIIDANGDKMYKNGHVPGALHFSKVEKNFETVLPKDKNALIIAYCGGPMCSAWEEAAKSAKAKGYTNIRHFKGGIKGWVDAKQPTEKG